MTRNDALARFRRECGIEARFDPAVQFATSSALNLRAGHELRKALTHIANKGFANAPTLELPQDLRGWDFGRRIYAEASASLAAKRSKATARELLKDLIQPLVEGHFLPRTRRGHHQLLERRFAILITYMWKQLGRRPLTARRLFLLAFGVGVADHVEDVNGAWGSHNRNARAVIAKFDPKDEPGPRTVSDLVDLYAAIADMTYHPRLRRTPESAPGMVVRGRPDHRELVTYILDTQPRFDAAAAGRGEVVVFVPPVVPARKRMWSE